MKIGIIAAMEQELRLLVDHLENKVEHHVLGNTYYEGKLGRHQVVFSYVGCHFGGPFWSGCLD